MTKRDAQEMDTSVDWCHFPSFFRSLSDPFVSPASTPRTCDICWIFTDVEHLRPTRIATRGTRFACSACRQHMNGIHCDWMPPNDKIMCQYCVTLNGWVQEDDIWTASAAWLEADEAANRTVSDFYLARINSDK